MPDPTCALRRLDGYAAHSRKELHALAAGKARDCRSALLISSGSTFEACASACAEQPFCEAITWARGACYHEHCAYHFQADVMPYTCLYSRLWWCVGLGTFIHMQREDGENRTNPW